VLNTQRVKTQLLKQQLTAYELTRRANTIHHVSKPLWRQDAADNTILCGTQHVVARDAIDACITVKKTVFTHNNSLRNGYHREDIDDIAANQ